MPDTKLTASVVGGGMGGKLSLNALQQSESFALVAVADLKPEVRQELQTAFPGVRTFATHQEMFASCPTDVVCVSTYAPSHEEVTRDALAVLPLQGILVEKPLGHTAASGRRILEAIRSRGLPMAVPHGLLAKRTSLEIIERVRGGEIGELKLVEMQCDKWDIINAGIHWFDFFVTLTGNEPIAWVLAACDTSTRTFRDGMQVETLSVAYLQTESGIRAVLNSGDYVQKNPGPYAPDGAGTVFRIVGTAGLIEFWGWAKPYTIQNAAHPDGEVVMPDELSVTGHRRHLEKMAAMIGGEPDYSIPEGSLMALEICEAAYLSARHRCQVTFPLAGFVPPPLTDWEPGSPYSGTGGGRDGRRLA